LFKFTGGIRINQKNEFYYINERIRVAKVRLLSNTGENLGVMDTREALKKAKEVELDLVLLAPNIDPPVAKIMDFAKFLYTERKKKSQSKAKAKKSELKEFRFGPTIGTGDLSTRIDRSKEFVQDGNRVKITVIMKGREGMFPEVALERLKKFEEGLKEVAKPEGAPRRMGNQLSVVFVGK